MEEKNNMRSLILILCSIFFLSCSSDEIKIDPDNLLIGIWNYSGFQENRDVYSRADGFTENHCYKFNPDGTLVERKIDGWCGTPPVSYADYTGSWAMLNDTLVLVQVGYWGGQTSYNLDIESLGTESLIFNLIQPN